jgi:hypothetical protein
MIKFLLGLATAVLLVFAADFCYLRFGFVEPRADIPVNSLESAISMPSLDAAIDQRATEVRNLVPATDDNIYSIFQRFNLEWKTRTLRVFTPVA